jgi:hypothetical protein
VKKRLRALPKSGCQSERSEESTFYYRDRSLYYRDPSL